jgi:hypothetical protein
MTCPNYSRKGQRELYQGVFPGSFRFIDILPPRRIRLKPGPKPKGDINYHPPRITQKIGRPRKEKAPSPPKRKKERMLSAAEADRRIREMDKLKIEYI